MFIAMIMSGSPRRGILLRLVLACLWGLLGQTGTSHADIRTTKHALAADPSVKQSSDPKEICVFCHTPAVVATGAIPEKPPHWHSSLPRDFSFTIYDDIGRLNLDKPSVGSQSIACLSCHDANQALEVGKSTDNHPFGVPYAGAFKRAPQMKNQAERVATASGAPFRMASGRATIEDFRDASSGVIENRYVWWVSKEGITARRSRNDLPLYPRAEGEGSETIPYIECSSCHDPHTSNDLFLRVNNHGSDLCLTCHNK